MFFLFKQKLSGGKIMLDEIPVIGRFYLLHENDALPCRVKVISLLQICLSEKLPSDPLGWTFFGQAPIKPAQETSTTWAYCYIPLESISKNAIVPHIFKQVKNKIVEVGVKVELPDKSVKKTSSRFLFPLRQC